MQEHSKTRLSCAKQQHLDTSISLCTANEAQGYKPLSCSSHEPYPLSVALQSLRSSLWQTRPLHHLLNLIDCSPWLVLADAKYYAREKIERAVCFESVGQGQLGLLSVSEFCCEAGEVKRAVADSKGRSLRRV